MKVTSTEFVPSFARCEVLILGFGNELYGDDGLGSYIARKLKDLEKRGNIKVLDCGAAGQLVLDVIKEEDPVKKIIIVDAIKDLKEKEVVKIKNPEITTDRPFDVHSIRVNTTELLKKGKEIILIGYKPSQLSKFFEFSGSVERISSLIIEKILEEIS